MENTITPNEVETKSNNKSNIARLARNYKILKKTLLHLDNKRLLSLIIYNKKIKNLFNITIDTYEEISEKFKIGGINGYGKVFTKDNELIFEGDYRNNKKKEMEKEKNIVVMEIYYLMVII